VLDSAFTPLAVPRLGASPVDARSEADRARTRGYADGFAEGRRVALEEARAEQAREDERMRMLRDAYVHERGAALSALQASKTALDERATTFSHVAAARIEELAVELATAILGVELSEPARSAAHALRRALDAMPVGLWTRVTLSDRDEQTLREDPDASHLLDGIEVVTASDVDPGGAIVEIEDGAVDTRIGEALRRAVDALRGVDEHGGEVLT